MNDTSTKWWPIPIEEAPEYYWPEGARRDDSIDAFIDGFGQEGFHACEDADLEEGFDKIAVYASGNNSPQHVARQLPSGRWTSKLGPDEDIEHGSLSDLQASRYGYPVLFMRKPRDRQE
jgi:hypothetical protein